MASLNVIVCGGAGVGKSSVINLIAGRDVAPTSTDAVFHARDALSFQRHDLSVAGRTLRMWETVGLDNATTTVSPDGATATTVIANAFALIQEVVGQGGLDLLVFCLSGNRVNQRTQKTYRLFYEVLCQSQVPIVFVITNLEQELDMEAWWTRNEASLLKRFELKAMGHACVTCLPTEEGYRESRAAIERLLGAYSGERKFVMAAEPWMEGFLGRLGTLLSMGELNPEEFERVLAGRYGPDAKTARESAKVAGQGSAFPLWPVLAGTGLVLTSLVLLAL